MAAFKDQNSKFVKYADEFSKDLKRLHPLSKLEGIGANKESRARLPNLINCEEAYAEDLIMAIEDLLSPSEEVQACLSWQRSRLRILAVAQMMNRLVELKQKELYVQAKDTLKQHIDLM